MNIKIEKAYLSGEIDAIPSKSYAHRIAICNFLSGEEPTANCGEFSSNDIFVTENCLKNLKEGKAVLDCGESGSTLRFMLPLCAALGGNYTFIGHGKLMDRPNEELFAVLKANGVSAVKTDKIEISGCLSAGEYKIRGDISSQYISGLLMALPTLNGDSKITLTTPLVSAPYVDITIEVLEKYGVKIIKERNGYIVKGNQVYKGFVKPEGDWSNMAFFLVAGAVNGDITVSGLNIDSVQGDKYIIDILKKAGASIELKGDKIRVKKSNLKAFTYSAEDCPDLVPISAVLASYAQGVTVISNIERLKIKESDRVESTIAMLKGFGINADTDGKCLAIFGGKVTAGVADAFNNHRLAMSTAVLALGVDGVSQINGAEAINKSYPTFFRDYNKLGGASSEV